MATLHWTRCRLLMVALALFCLQWHWHSADALRVDANADLSAADDAALLSNDQLQSLSSPSAVTMMPLQLGGAGAGNMKAHFQADFPAVQLGQDTRTATAADDDSPTSISASFSQNQVVNATGPLIDATPLSDDSGVPVSPDNINVDLYPARIVSSLGSGGKRKRFVENSQSTYDNRVGHAVDTLDQADPVFQQLAQKYRDMQQDMINDKHWIEDVKSIINHYQAKIKSVQTNMKTVAKQAENIKKAVYSRHEYNHQKVLEQQLKDIQLQLNNMHYQARSMVGQAKVLDKIKSSLRQSMQTIEQEMSKIQSKAASSDAAVMAASHM